MSEEIDGIVPARPAATVLLLRDGRDGVEVYMQKRPAEMSFAASAHIFPGGSMDERDGSDEALGLVVDVDLGVVAGRMGLAGDEAGLRRCCALHVCAVRELAEETGVVLARRRDGGALDARDAADLSRRLREGADFVTAVAQAGLRLAIDELTYVAHFVTPVDLPRRYDTHFFVASAPAEQEAAVMGGEASGGGWYSSASVLAASTAGEVMLMPPTRILCAELGRHRDVAAVVTDLGARPVPAILFRLPRVLRGPIPDHLPSVEEVAAMEAFD